MADTTVSTPPPSAAPSAPSSPSAAPPSGPLGRDEAAAMIAEIRGNREHPFHKGATAALSEMARLYEAVHGTDAAPSGASLPPDLNYEVAVPPGQTEESFSPIDRNIATAAAHAFGLSESEANPVVAWILDASRPKPPLPSGRAIPSAERAEQSLQEHWGAHWPRQMAQARAALEILDLRRGGRRGELADAFAETKAGNHPGVIKEFARLGAALKADPEAEKLIAKYEKQFADQYARARGRKP